MIKDTIKTNAVLDTLEIDVLKDNVSNAESIFNEDKKYIRLEGNRKDKDSYYRLRLSPKYLVGYNNTNSSINVEKAVKEIIGEIESNRIHVEPNRIDIAIDSSLNYTNYLKLHLYLFELITFKNNSKGKMICTNLNTLRDNNIYLNSRDLKLSIYDKALESNGLHPFQTRIEFRWCRYVNLDTKKSAKKALEKLKNIEENDNDLKENMIERLANLYKIEIKNGSITDFTDFVRKYDKYFYTSGIVKGVYTAIDFVGDFNNWFKYFKKNNHSCNYYSLKDIKKYKAAIIKSLKNYIKN